MARLLCGTLGGGMERMGNHRPEHSRGRMEFEQFKAPVTVWTEGAPNARVYARKPDPAEFAAPAPFNPNAWT